MTPHQPRRFDTTTLQETIFDTEEDEQAAKAEAAKVTQQVQSSPPQIPAQTQSSEPESEN